jgi:hypothetical protein
VDYETYTAHGLVANYRISEVSPDKLGADFFIEFGVRGNVYDSNAISVYVQSLGKMGPLFGTLSLVLDVG